MLGSFSRWVSGSRLRPCTTASSSTPKTRAGAQPRRSPARIYRNGAGDSVATVRPDIPICVIFLESRPRRLPLYTLLHIVHVDIHNHAASDLRELMALDPIAAAIVVAVLEQIQCDPLIIDKLTDHGRTNTTGAFKLGIKRWESMRGTSNLWRFRIFDTPATSYRVVYGYHWQTRQIIVFAVVHKSRFDYDNPNDELNQRIANDWKSL